MFIVTHRQTKARFLACENLLGNEPDIWQAGEDRSTQWSVPVTDQAWEPTYSGKQNKTMHSQSRTHQLSRWRDVICTISFLSPWAHLRSVIKTAFFPKLNSNIILLWPPWRRMRMVMCLFNTCISRKAGIAHTATERELNYREWLLRLKMAPWEKKKELIKNKLEKSKSKERFTANKAEAALLLRACWYLEAQLQCRNATGYMRQLEPWDHMWSCDLTGRVFRLHVMCLRLYYSPLQPANG